MVALEKSLSQKIITSGIWVATSAAGIHFLTLLRSIVLARLLTPEIFGLMGICIIVIRAIEVFSETGFSAALIHRKENFEDAKNTAYCLIVMRGFVLASIALVLAPFVAGYYQADNLKALIQVIAVSLILNGVSNINVVFFEKQLNFKRICLLNQSVALVNTILVIVLAYYLRSVWALVIGHVASAAVAASMSFILIPGKPKFQFNKKLAQELFGYGKYLTGLTAVTFIALEIDNFVVGKVLGMEALGFYVIAYMLGNLPTTHFVKIFMKVLFPAFSKLQDDRKAIRDGYLKALEFLSVFSFPAAAGLIAIAPEIIEVIYGPNWNPAILPLRLLSVFGCLRALTSLGGYLFNAIGRPNFNFYINLLLAFLIAIMIYPLTYRHQLVGTALAITIPLGVQTTIGFLLLKKLIDLKIRQVLRVLSPPLLTSLTMVLILLYAKTFLHGGNPRNFVVLILIGLFSYALLNYRRVLYFGNEARKMVWTPSRNGGL